MYDNPDRIISAREPLSYINKQLNDNLDSINYLTYSIINHTNAEETGNNKVTSIKQNEFIINIHTFKTLINESSSIYYTQNLALTSTIDPYKYNSIIRRNVKPRWLLNNNFK